MMIRLVLLFLASSPLSVLAHATVRQQHISSSLSASSSSWSSSSSSVVVRAPSSRRTFLSSAFLGSGPRYYTTPNLALAATTENNDNKEEVYFGIGCFWHVQHEMIAAEQTLLKRSPNQYTSRTGYAGGRSADAEGRVCYHNFSGMADYGKLGHGEVVGIRLPSRAIGDFARVYFDLFIKGDRVDTMDKGGEYRSLLGLPGGRNHPMFSQVENAAIEKGLTLVDGKGNDSDTLGKRLVYVMDSIKFPFHQAEVYHQYHNDFLSPAYGKEYNRLVEAALEDGRIKITGCPDRVNNVKTVINETVHNRIVFICVAAMLGVLLLGLVAFHWREKFLYIPIHNDDDDDDDDDDANREDDDVDVEITV